MLSKPGFFWNKSVERERERDSKSLLHNTGLVCHSMSTGILDSTAHSVCSYVH